MRPPMHRAPRGQAMAETALGTLVIVGVLLVGTHLSDLGFLSLKVHEAATGAVWDATAYRVHQPHLNVAYDPSATLAVVQTNANNRYQDYDGRRSANGAAPLFAFTRASQVQVQCARDLATTFSIGANANATPGFTEPGGLACSAIGGVDIANVPEAFNEVAGGGHSQTSIRPFTGTIPLCSTGRSPCTRTTNILLGDYGFSFGQTNAPESQDCPVQPAAGQVCTNGPFYGLTQDLFNRSVPQFMGRGDNGGHAVNWARLIVRDNPPFSDLGITGFYMSYRGRSSPDPYSERLPNDELYEAQPYVQAPQDSARATTAREACRSAHGGRPCYLGRYPTD